METKAGSALSRMHSFIYLWAYSQIHFVFDFLCRLLTMRVGAHTLSQWRWWTQMSTHVSCAVALLKTVPPSEWLFWMLMNHHVSPELDTTWRFQRTALRRAQLDGLVPWTQTQDLATTSGRGLTSGSTDMPCKYFCFSFYCDILYYVNLCFWFPMLETLTPSCLLFLYSLSACFARAELVFCIPTYCRNLVTLYMINIEFHWQ